MIDDLVELQRLWEGGVSRSMIARRLGVHRATITRELRRGSWQPERDHANLRPYLRNRLDTRGPHERLYLGSQAQLQADTRGARSHQPYRMVHDRLVDWVISALRRGWTPQEIAGRLPSEFPDDPRMRVSAETVYGWIYAPGQRHRQFWQYLPRGQRKRRKRQGRKVHSERIKWRTSIHDRPAVIENRHEFGHWEADSVLGLRGTGGLHTNVERRSRKLFAIKIESITAQATLEAQLTIFTSLPAHVGRSVTADNGSEFAYHYKLADTLAIPTYFADPYSAYQRGTNEHFNGRIRRYCPRAPALLSSPRQNSTNTLLRSTTGHAKYSAGQHPPKSSRNYHRRKPHRVALRTRTRVSLLWRGDLKAIVDFHIVSIIETEAPVYKRVHHCEFLAKV